MQSHHVWNSFEQLQTCCKRIIANHSTNGIRTVSNHHQQSKIYNTLIVKQCLVITKVLSLRNSRDADVPPPVVSKTFVFCFFGFLKVFLFFWEGGLLFCFLVSFLDVFLVLAQKTLKTLRKPKKIIKQALPPPLP